MPNLEDFHIKAANEYENKNFDEALKIYNEIIRLNPADEVALSCVMDIYLEIDDKFNYYLSRANVNISQNKLEYAIKDTRKAIEINPDDIDARRKLARLYKVDNKYLKAIDEFLKLIDMDSTQQDAYIELVELYMSENSIDSAILTAQRAVEAFNSDEMKNMLAQLYFKANNYKAALEVVQDKFLKIKIMLQDEQNEEANAILSGLDFNTLTDIEKVSYYLLKSQYLYNTKQYNEALSTIEEYAKLIAPNAILFQMRALIYEELNDEFKAYFNWGFYNKYRNRFDEAIVEFENALRINSKDKTTLIELANLYQQNKERYVSIEYWQKVYEIDQDEQAKQILAEFYYSEGNFEKAEEFGKVKEQKNRTAEAEENYTGLLDKIMGFFAKK